MGVAPTGQIFKGFTFDGESSKDYGIYITGSAVYNAPVRDVEMISIPGRNGSFALDKGRFENIEVTYPAGIYADTESDFAQGISDFRNFLASRQGYVELSDDYNLGEYRLAVYKSGLDVSPEQLRAGEFEITFECKPQRFLTSGETEETVANNGTLTNPTLFDAHPMLEVWGSGKVEFAGQSVTVNGTTPIGIVPLAGDVQDGNQILDTALLNNGDNINIGTCAWDLYFQQTDTSHGAIASVSSSDYFCETNGSSIFVSYGYKPNTCKKGTSKLMTINGTVAITYEDTTTASIPIDLFVQYNGTDNVMIFETVTEPTGIEFAKAALGIRPTTGYSSMLTAGSPCYIDLDIGEAYKEVSGSYVSLNNTVEIGGDLPVLPPGTTTFTYPNTVTQFKVIPRWWKV